jgi:beta-phosphoglucomutase
MEMPMYDKTRLAIFDLDGTLFDTFPVNYASYSEALREYGYTVTEDYFRNCCYTHYSAFLPAIVGHDKDKIELIHKKKQVYYREYLGKARMNSHLFNMLDVLRSSYYTAIVTTASKTNCGDILRFFDKKDRFDLLVTPEDYAHAKPDPEGFIKAMEYFKMPAGETLIFEDSDIGIEAARKTGASVFIVNQF